MRRIAAIVTALVAVRSLAMAEPAQLARARAHVAALEYDRAQVVLDAALRAGDNDPATTAALYGLVGVVAASRDQRAAAQAAFERQLVLDPAATVDVELGPKLSTPFTAALTALARQRLAVRVESGPLGTVTLVVEHDPRAMVAGARAVYRTPSGTENVVRATGSGRIQVTLPLGTARDITVAAVDEYGNRLVELAVAPPAVPLPPPRPIAQPRPSRGWIYFGGAAVAATATATVFAVLARSTQSQIDDARAHPAEHSFSELRTLDDTGARRTLIANIGFGAGVACAITSGIFYFKF